VGQYFYDAEWWTYDSNVQSQLIAAINAAKQGVISRYDVTVKMGEDLIPVDFQISPIRDTNGNIVGLLPTAVDITDRKLIEVEISKQANFDELTGLPNRRLFNDRLEQAIKKSKRDKSLTALLLVDLDRFKEINDASGHGVGDILLVEAASRILLCVRDYDTVARLGGDEFTVILSSLDDYSDISRIAQSIIDSISRPYLIQGREMFVSASIGIALNPDDADNAADLIKSADQAMYQAKNDGRSRYHFFTKVMQETADLKARLTSDLRRALTEGQLEVYYQPIIDLGTRRVEKAEALLRWKHPKLGFISPTIFIPLAEDTGIIHDIGYWVFMQASRQVKKLRSSLGRDFQISVNKSPIQFFTPGSNHWADQLATMGILDGSISIEITEGLLMNNDSGITASLLKYHDAGIQVAIDDFGTGYSALSYLKKFDFDYLKIDKSFTRNLEHEAPDFALCEAIVVMAHKLGLKVIAEGVETEQQRDLLTQIGCDYGQGYLFSRPLPVDDFEEFLING
jgi:diguanylate cyclase (GGDEF)-like protein